jgi:hypothetical protein
MRRFARIAATATARFTRVNIDQSDSGVQPLQADTVLTAGTVLVADGYEV